MCGTQTIMASVAKSHYASEYLTPEGCASPTPEPIIETFGVETMQWSREMKDIGGGRPRHRVQFMGFNLQL